MDRRDHAICARADTVVENFVESNRFASVGTRLGSGRHEFDAGQPGYLDLDKYVKYGAGYENERGRVRIAAQISRGLNYVSEEVDFRSGGYERSFLYAPFMRDYGGTPPGDKMLIGSLAVSMGMQQTVETVYHERLHTRWGSDNADHQRVYNRVYDDLTPLGFSGHYLCLDKDVGCRP
jgi:hypothetical protein